MRRRNYVRECSVGIDMEAKPKAASSTITCVCRQSRESIDVFGIPILQTKGGTVDDT